MRYPGKNWTSCKKSNISNVKENAVQRRDYALNFLIYNSNFG